MSWMRTALTWVTSKMAPPRVIYDRAGGSPYLSRWYLYGSPKASDGKPVFNWDGNPRSGITWTDRTGPLAIYLHRFHRGDDDLDLHSHPWLWSVSLILAGGYREERRAFHGKWGDMGTVWHVAERVLRPGMFNVIRGDDFHRVDLLEEDAWSLFFAGPRVSSWSFWDRWTGETTPWREFIARKRGEDINNIKET
jgi:hypothetical protein